MTKKLKIPKPKKNQLLVQYGIDEFDEPDLYYCYPENDSNMSRDSMLICHALESVKLYSGLTLTQELITRGYDITTLRFSIKKVKK